MTVEIVNTAEAPENFMHDAAYPWAVILRGKKKIICIGRYDTKAKAQRVVAKTRRPLRGYE